MVMPRDFSSGRRSGSVPVSALTSALLPWSTWPAVAMIKCWTGGISCLSRRGTELASGQNAHGAHLERRAKQSQPRPTGRSDDTAHLAAGAPADGWVGALLRLLLAGQRAKRCEQFCVLRWKNRAQVELQLASGDIADHRNRTPPQPRGYFLRFECAVRQIERDRSNYRAWQRATSDLCLPRPHSGPDRQPVERRDELFGPRTQFVIRHAHHFQHGNAPVAADLLGRDPSIPGVSERSGIIT